MSNRESGSGLVVVIILVIIALAKVNNKDIVTATVTSKTVKRTGDSDRYMVFTNKETFMVKDSWLLGQFSSSDLFGRIKDGETYTFKVYGWRLPFFSSYRVIYGIE